MLSFIPAGPGLAEGTLTQGNESNIILEVYTLFFVLSNSF